MSLTLPNLDDRTFADLVEEARSLLPVFAPDLTNHNPSEPLITLTELFAYFIEILIYRLNLVTDANRLAFLRLMNGPAWQPPASSDVLDAEVRRTVLSLRQTDRAVTPADFEFLSRPAHLESRIARVHCIAERDFSIEDPALRLDRAPGHVSVVIVARDPDDLDILRQVDSHLEPRRLLTTRVHVVAPRYVPVSVQVTLHLLPDAREDAVKQRAIDALAAWFDPIAGSGGTGWPFGRSVNVSEVYGLLDALDGVDFVVRTPEGDNTLDELRTKPEFAGRLIRNADRELIGLSLNPGELVEARIAPDDIKVVTPHS